MVTRTGGDPERNLLAAVIHSAVKDLASANPDYLETALAFFRPAPGPRRLDQLCDYLDLEADVVRERARVKAAERLEWLRRNPGEHPRTAKLRGTLRERLEAALARAW